MRRTNFVLPGLLVAFVVGYVVRGGPSHQSRVPDPQAAMSDFGSLSSASAGREVYYSRCAEARAAGAAPIHVGEAGYREGLDADGDGIACEPYRRDTD